MMQMLSSFSLSSFDWLIILLCAMLIGMSKTGVPGVSMVVVPALALIFGGKPSTGVLLPILIMADIFAVIYYHRHARWEHLLRSLPWAMGGILLALWIGNLVDDVQFRQIIAITVFISIALMIWKDYGLKNDFTPDAWWFAALMGIAGGFATMIGNVAGPIFAIYLLAMHLNKQNFIGTTAWFFFIVNLSKFPLQILVWKNINSCTLLIDLISFPAIILGAWLGVIIVKRIQEKTFKWLVIIVTIISAFLILV